MGQDHFLLVASSNYVSVSHRLWDIITCLDCVAAWDSEKSDLWVTTLKIILVYD